MGVRNSSSSGARLQVRKNVIVDGRLNASIVGQSVQRLAQIFGIAVPPGTKVLIGEVEAIGHEEPLSEVREGRACLERADVRPAGAGAGTVAAGIRDCTHGPSLSKAPRGAGWPAGAAAVAAGPCGCGRSQVSQQGGSAAGRPPPLALHPALPPAPTPAPCTGEAVPAAGHVPRALVRGRRRHGRPPHPLWRPGAHERALHQPPQPRAHRPLWRGDQDRARAHQLARGAGACLRARAVACALTFMHARPCFPALELLPLLLFVFLLACSCWGTCARVLCVRALSGVGGYALVPGQAPGRVPA